MLAIKTTEKLTGVTVSGTYWDLNALYDALSNVIGEEGSYHEYEACWLRVLGLCYDIRHAYQGDRNRGELSTEMKCFRLNIFGLRWCLSMVYWKNLLTCPKEANATFGGKVLNGYSIIPKQRMRS